MSDFKVIETQEEFDKAIQSRLAQAERSAAEKYKDYLAPDAVAALKADYEKQLNDVASKLQAAQTTLSEHNQTVSDLTERAVKAETKLLKQNAAHAKGLPLELADRLIGKDQTELEKDAEEMAALFKPAAAPPMRSYDPSTTDPSRSASDTALLQILGQLTPGN